MSMAAVPGTGPSTGPLSVVRKVHRATFSELDTSRTLVMGILNVTDNSFSDGGEHFSVESAIDHGLRMHYAGADLVDVGGESTAPGRQEVSAEEEQQRILPVVEALIKAGVLVSVDTRHAATARAAMDYGEIIINDVSGLNFDPEMPHLIAETGAKYILTHNRGNATTMDDAAEYEDLTAEVVAELGQIIEAFTNAGVCRDQLIVDPGLGFAKLGAHNWELLGQLEAIEQLGYPVLVGASRKRFLGTVLANRHGEPRPVDERDIATAAVTALVAQRKIWAVRVHDVPTNLDAVKVATAWADAR
ncbi:dihydropteroate synthase [Auritidibacter ignavus]|uniref:dihydropteroate synthase n=1 Tax=Auritidibacter ignavus TaxID=678932 RepID=UPI000F015D54|nr:dihydropteroate synthase [Auritidibacter ignavus]NIH72578.1 dihydropteroate synthase [Auritidibacter ignavus]RMX22616.1 dihydropteroate synthase [Auritidibacter ignavus]